MPLFSFMLFYPPPVFSRSAMRLHPRLLHSACPMAPSISIVKPRPFEEMPGPSSWPIFGSHKFIAKSSVSEYTQYLQQLYLNHGPVVREELGFGRGTVVHLFDPEDSQRVFRAESRQPRIVPLQETTQMYREMRGMNPGLGNQNGESWYNLRAAVNQTMMRPQDIDKYVPLTEQVASRLVDHIMETRNNKGEADMKRISGRWSLESSGLLVFERRLGALGEEVEWADRLIDLNHDIFILSAELKLGLPLFRYFSTPKWNKMVKLEDEFCKEANMLMDRAVSEFQEKEKRGRENEGSSEGEKNNNESRTREDGRMLVGKLINHPNLKVRDVKVLMLSLFADGLSTTAPMLVYNIYNIAKHPEIQRKLRDEINSVASKGELLDAARRNRLPLLRACIKETFRLFPIGTEVSRITDSDLVLGGFHVPANTAVDINTNVLTRCESLFPKALSFEPERWLRENKGDAQGHPFAFLPFGFGPRMCAGRRFAEQDLQVVLARLVQSFDIGHRRGDIGQRYETLLLPDGDCTFEFSPIQRK